MTDPGPEPTLAALLNELIQSAYSEGTNEINGDNDRRELQSQTAELRATILARFGGDTRMTYDEAMAACEEIVGQMKVLGGAIVFTLNHLDYVGAFKPTDLALAPTETEAAAKEERENYG